MCVCVWKGVTHLRDNQWEWRFSRPPFSDIASIISIHWYVLRLEPFVLYVRYITHIYKSEVAHLPPRSDIIDRDKARVCVTAGEFTRYLRPATEKQKCGAAQKAGVRNFKTPIVNKTRSWDGSSLLVSTLVTNKNKTPKKHINTKDIQPQTRCPPKKKKKSPFSLSVDSDVTNKQTCIYLYVQYTPPLSKIHCAPMLSYSYNSHTI